MPARAQPENPGALMPSFKDYPVAAVMASVLFLIVVIMMFYGVRHFLFTMNRLIGVQRHPYIDIAVARWPMITVFIAAHNEEKVIAGCIEALLNTDYLMDRLKIIPVNDRSKDRTGEIIDSYVVRFPSRISPFHRTSGKAGKSAALKDALSYAEGDIAIIFDADYVPGRGLLKQLVAPFFDPEVGAVMGRVVPVNSGANLLTRMLDLERSGGYQVDQQARMNMNLMPQYGGTVGGVRLSAVQAVG
ncbi:MAG: glycosyltransferase family 2 protein, partial [Polaromonas sp.]|nr:glycosyltransferase family 2 protein [Polaromonas sp.]